MSKKSIIAIMVLISLVFITYASNLLAASNESANEQPQAPRISVSPASINITADNGPGFYYSEKITLNIIAPETKWNIEISASDLKLDDSRVNKQKFIDVKYLSASIDQKDGDYTNFNNGGLYITGSGNTLIELYVRVKTKWKHEAGTYKGDVNFTFSVN